MRNLKLYLSALTMAGLASLSLGAQQPTQNPSPSNPSPITSAGPASGSQSTPVQNRAASSNAAPVQSTANSPEAVNAELRPVQGELEKKLDAKSAKPGDLVVLKTTEKATIADGVVIPKGSKITGRVVDDVPVGKGEKNSKVTLQFDRAQLKGGHTLPIRTILQSVAPASGSGAVPDSFGATGATPMAAPAGGSAATTSPGMGGGAAATASAQPNAGEPNAVQPNPSAQAGMAQGNNGSAGNAAPAAGTVVARQGNVSIKTTAIPGVLIGANADGKPFSNAAGVLLGAGRNVELEGGTHVVLAVADAGTKPANAR